MSYGRRIKRTRENNDYALRLWRARHNQCLWFSLGIQLIQQSLYLLELLDCLLRGREVLVHTPYCSIRSPLIVFFYTEYPQKWRPPCILCTSFCPHLTVTLSLYTSCIQIAY